LIWLGHKRIAFVGGACRVSPARERTEAFRAILPRFGLPLGPIVNCLPMREGGAAAVGQLFQDKSNAPTAVVCHNDLCALGVMLGLADFGLAPGRDVAVIGFNNIPEGAMHRPALTTVALGARDRPGSGSSVAAPHRAARRLAGKHHLAAAARHSLKLRLKTTI
jgi:LacI family transcriptional regulator